MTKRYVRANAIHSELAADYLDHRDEEVMQALVTAGALVALADGELHAVERDELVNFVDRQGFVPTSSPRDIGEAFDSRVRELGEPSCANVIVDTLRPMAGRSLASVVVRTAERVAAADRRIHPGELRALKLIRRVMMALPAGKPPVRMTEVSALRCSSECQHCGAVLISPEWWESASNGQTVMIWHCPICGNEFRTTENQAGKKTLDAELVRAFFPSLLVA
jgi:tellurite resistance protein